MTQHLRLQVNGQLREYVKDTFPTTVGELILAMELDPSTIVVEVNGDIVKRNQVDSHALSPGDRVELVKFVGGG